MKSFVHWPSESKRILSSVPFSVWQWDWETQCEHGTISHHIYTWHKGTSELQTAQPFCTFPVASLPVAHWVILKWATVLKCNPVSAGCYQYVSVMCNKFGRAIISKTSFDLKLNAIQLPHSDKSTKSFPGSPNTIQQLLIQDKASFRSLPLQ